MIYKFLMWSYNKKTSLWQTAHDTVYFVAIGWLLRKLQWQLFVLPEHDFEFWRNIAQRRGNRFRRPISEKKAIPKNFLVCKKQFVLFHNYRELELRNANFEFALRVYWSLKGITINSLKSIWSSGDNREKTFWCSANQISKTKIRTMSFE